ncbi:hypothetical protein SBOR_7313 [Sclerotinia borealis F-4128]|uniref:Uncharacterized protein n=1 Tax=Sclerotinia borealis (strain F-4128) TaxID=1432307 RepID=W9C6E4_SCLBF|nr:hypothetical protein SBOR_7313 [Sclerotinia borealis F-4128]
MEPSPSPWNTNPEIEGLAVWLTVGLRCYDKLASRSYKAVGEPKDGSWQAIADLMNAVKECGDWPGNIPRFTDEMLASIFDEPSEDNEDSEEIEDIEDIQDSEDSEDIQDSEDIEESEDIQDSEDIGDIEKIRGALHHSLYINEDLPKRPALLPRTILQQPPYDRGVFSVEMIKNATLEVNKINESKPHDWPNTCKHFGDSQHKAYNGLWRPEAKLYEDPESRIWYDPANAKFAQGGDDNRPPGPGVLWFKNPDMTNFPIMIQAPLFRLSFTRPGKWY